MGGLCRELSLLLVGGGAGGTWWEVCVGTACEVLRVQLFWGQTPVDGRSWWSTVVLNWGVGSTLNLGGRRDFWSSQLVSVWIRCHSVSSVRRVPSELMMVNHHFDLEFRGLRDFLTVSWDEAAISAGRKDIIVLRIVSAEQLLLVPQTILNWEGGWWVLGIDTAEVGGGCGWDCACCWDGSAHCGGWGGWSEWLDPSRRGGCLLDHVITATPFWGSARSFRHTGNDYRGR